MGACWQPQTAWLCRESYTCCLFVLASEVSAIKHVRAVVGVLYTYSQSRGRCWEGWASQAASSRHKVFKG